MKRITPIFLTLLSASALLIGCEVPIEQLEQKDIADSMDEHLRALFVGTWYVDNPATGTPCMTLEREGAMLIVEYDASGVSSEIAGAWRVEDDIFTQVVNEEARNFLLVKLTTKTLVYEETKTKSAQYYFHKK
jgi:hypothetical protein